MSTDTIYGPNFDIVGDIHGHAEPLEGLLDELGYVRRGGEWEAPEGHTLVFVGDLIDRGPNQLRVLEIVKSLVDAQVALITLGNHEFNALCWSIRDPRPDGGFLRPHETKKRKQHAAFLDQLSKQERETYLDWFLTIPLWLELDGLRVIHACWEESSRELVEDALSGSRFVTKDQVVRIATDEQLKAAVEILLKGPELDLTRHNLPEFVDKDGTPRTHARIKWWVRGSDRVVDLAEIPPGSKTDKKERYPKIERHLVADEAHQFDFHEGTPVFYGHYWRRHEDGLEIACTEETACVDFSAGKGGPLAAYQWSEGDSSISPEGYVLYR